MKKFLIPSLVFFLFLAAGPSEALSPGTDLLVPAAGRGGGWVTDLYVLNPSSETASVSIYWLVRGQANTDPTHMDYTLAPAETVNLEDVILNEFGFDAASGAFRVVADHEVLVNSRIYAAGDNSTFGQGFEGIPLSMATGAGSSTDIVGLSVNDDFRTNFYACAGPNGATISLSLRTPDATEIASGTETLGAYEPFLQNIETMLESGNFDAGTLHINVTAGSVIAGASKVDNASTDPTTLEGSADCPAGGSGTDGIYQMGIYDSLNYATGGQLIIENDVVTGIDATYTNWDKVDGTGNPSCKWIFIFGPSLSGTPTLDELEEGISIVADYSSHDLGTITYTLTLTPSGNGFSGTLDAVGSDFPAEVDGCNGEFPQQNVSIGILPLP